MPRVSRFIPIVLMLVLGGCYVCEEAEEVLAPDPFVGVRGTLYSRGTSCQGQCLHGDDGVVRAYGPDGAEVGAARADYFGDFELRLAPGRYRITALLDGAEADDTIGTLEITAQGGYLLQRIYEQRYQKDVLSLVFAASVSEARRAEILRDYDLVDLPARAQVAGERRVRTMWGQDSAFEIRQRLLAELDEELVAVSLNYLVCDAAGDGAWPLTEGSSGGGGDDWD